MRADLVGALLRGAHRVTLAGVGRNGTGATVVETYDCPKANASARPSRRPGAAR